MINMHFVLTNIHIQKTAMGRTKDFLAAQTAAEWRKQYMEQKRFDVETKRVLLTGLQQSGYSLEEALPEILEELRQLGSSSSSQALYAKTAAQFILAYLSWDSAICGIGSFSTLFWNGPAWIACLSPPSGAATPSFP